MRNNEEFDRLARQKMNERSFAFDELHWQKAQMMIAPKKSNKRYFHLLWLLIPVIATYLWIAETEAKRTFVELNENQIDSDSNKQEIISDKSTANSEQRSIDKKTESFNQNLPNETTAPAKQDLTAKPLENKIEDKTKNNRSKDVSSVKTKSNYLIKNEDKLINQTTTKTISKLKSSPALHSSDNQVEITSDLYTPVLEAQKPNVSSQLNNSAAQNSSTPYHELNKENALLSPSEELTQPLFESVDFMESIDGQFAEDANVLMHTKSIPVNLIKLWKISLLAGLWNNTTNITGLAPEAWMASTNGVNSFGYGAEVIRSYHHFGWGTGLHYSNYQETISVDPKKINVNETYRYWYLNPIDTTIWVITDSVTNGNGYTYIGYSEERTIQVITAANGTRTNSTIVREARKITNSVSYFEIPLLADIHTGKGNWLFGLRGGPTFGKLVVRTGALPNVEGIGYQEFENSNMRQWIPGYTIRAYADYKVNSQWSIGLQAGKRGLFGNTLNGDAITRKTNALGGMVSLSYLLRSKDQ
jgi:hypothetical protein